MIYVASEEGGPSKVGVAVVPAVRVSAVARECDRPVRLVWAVPFADCRRAEALVCRMLDKHRHKSFRVAGNREWFDVPPDRVIAAAERAIRILRTNDKAAIRRLCPPSGRLRVPAEADRRQSARPSTLDLIAALEGKETLP